MTARLHNAEAALPAWSSASMPCCALCLRQRLYQSPVPVSTLVQGLLRLWQCLFQMFCAMTFLWSRGTLCRRMRLKRNYKFQQYSASSGKGGEAVPSGLDPERQLSLPVGE